MGKFGIGNTLVYVIITVDLKRPCASCKFIRLANIALEMRSCSGWFGISEHYTCFERKCILLDQYNRNVLIRLASPSLVS